ncbi:hypothetical protein GCM10022245_14030 [Streptomyces mayteni]
MIELARFRILDGAERLLVSERPRMIEALHRTFPGCLAAYLTKEDDGSWLDVIVWRSREEAEEAARMITTIPECAAWFGHISESGGIRHVAVIDAWAAGRGGS